MARPRSQTADEVATSRVDAQLAAFLAALASQEQADARAAAQQQQAITGYSQAAAEMLRPIGGQVQQGYAQAGDRTAAMGQAFSAGFRDEMNKNAEGANALLAQQGSPQQVTSQGVGGADVLYGLGGYIPASTMQREGAAFGAAASMLPATQLGYGQQALGQAQREAAERRRLLQDKRFEVESQRPALMSAELDRIRSRNLERQKFAEEKRAARANERIQGGAVDTQAAYLANTLRNTGANITGIDPLTGQPTYEVISDVSAANAKAAKDAKTAKGKAKAAKAAAVKARNDKTVSAITDATDWVESQLKPGTMSNPAGAQPIKSHTRKLGKTTIQYYVKKGGGVTTNPEEAATKQVYDTVPLPRPQYRQLRRRVISRLTPQLRRFGYKPGAIVSMADEILNDYYTQAETLNPNANRTTSRRNRTDRRGGR